MFNELFNRELQQEMISYFLNELSGKGIIKNYKKGSIIDPSKANSVYIVVEGKVSQELFSEDGKQLCLFMLTPGTIFGEMDYVDGYRTCAVSTVAVDSKVAVINRDIIENEIRNNINVYKYFFHSTVRKYRILMLKIADDNFNDFQGKLASTLIRFAVMEEGDLFDGAKIKNINSITEFSKYLMCSRSTVSIGLSEFKKLEIIETEKNHIVIKDSHRLKEYVNFVW